MKQYFKVIMSLPFSIKWLLITELFYGFAMGIWEVTLNFNLIDKGFNNISIGNIAAFGAITTAISSIIIGEICTRLGYKSGIVIGCIIRTIGSFLMALFPGSIFLGQALFSVGGAFLSSAEFPLMTELIEKKHIQLVYNLLFGVYQFSMFFGNLVGGFVPKNIHSSIDPYSVLILFCSVIFALLGIGRAFLPNSKTKLSSSKINFNFIKNNMIIWFLLYGLIEGVIESLVLPVSLINTVYKDVFNLSDSNIGIIFSLATIVGCAAFFIAPIILDKYDINQISILLFLVNICSLLLLSFVKVQAFIFLWLISVFIFAIFTGISGSNMLKAVDDDKGRYCGFGVTSNFIGMAIGGKLSGFFLEYYTYSHLMIFASAIVLIQCFTYFSISKKYFSSELELEMY